MCATKAVASLCLVLAGVIRNTGAESNSNRLFSTQRPLALVLGKLALLASRFNIFLDVHHIPGAHNEEADALSRLQPNAAAPFGFTECIRFHFALPQLWQDTPRPRLFPKETCPIGGSLFFLPESPTCLKTSKGGRFIRCFGLPLPMN